MTPPPELDPRLRRVLARGAELGREFSHARADAEHRFIAADHADAIPVLRALVTESDSFLELGSGTGVIAILADLIGLQSVGVECDPLLVDLARQLAAEVGSNVEFVEGDFEDAEVIALMDYDIVYAYPWPGEEQPLRQFVHERMRPGARYLAYHESQGFHFPQQP